MKVNWYSLVIELPKEIGNKWHRFWYNVDVRFGLKKKQEDSK